MAGQRVLGRIRLSRLTDESTSAARQRELIEQWSAMHDHTVVGWAEDLDVSGSVDPFEAPALGPWFREDKHGEWDILVGWKLDRIGRRAIPLNRVFGWMMDHDKTLVCVSDNIDLSTWVGRLVANVIAGVAEGELEAIRERTRASRRKLLESGRWPGGQVPYGLLPKKNDTGQGWSLSVDPDTSKIVRRIVQEVIDGAAIEAVANRLDMDGIPGPKGGAWLPSTIWKLIQSKYLLGHATYEGETVRDGQGQAVLNAEPLLSRDTWDALQLAIQLRRVPETSKRTRDTSPLLGVVVCSKCELPLFHKVYNRDYGKRVYRYYHCRRKEHNQQRPAEDLESLLEQTFLEEVGDGKVQGRVFIQAESHKLELDEAVRAVDELTPLLGNITSATMRQRLTDQLRALDNRISELESMPISEARWDYQETDETYRESWESADTEGRRQLLIRSGITAAVGPYEFHLRVPADVRDRLSKGG